MEGGELLKFVSENKIAGIIIIKGVSDHADGKKTDQNESMWPFTAATAAFKYAESKLSKVTNLADEFELTE